MQIRWHKTQELSRDYDVKIFGKKKDEVKFVCHESKDLEYFDEESKEWKVIPTETTVIDYYD